MERDRCRGTSLAPALSTMDVAAILQALLGAGAPTTPAGTSSVAGAVEASFAALFAAASGTGRTAAAVALEESRPDAEQSPDGHTPAAADEQALSLAGAAAVAAFVSPSAVAGTVPVEAAPATAAAPAGAVETGAVAVEARASRPGSPDAQVAVEASPATAPDSPAPADGSACASSATAAAKLAEAAVTTESAVPAGEEGVPATASAREPARTAAPERVPASRHPAAAAAEPDASSPDAKAASNAPAIAPKGEPGAQDTAPDQNGDAVEGTVARAVDAPHRGADRAAAANGNGHGAAPVAGPAPGSDTDVGREPGRRGTDAAAAVVAGARRLGEVSEPKRSGSGADPSGPSSLPPPNPARESAHTEAATSEPQAARTGADVERLMRLDQLRPVRVRDGGEMRLEVAPEGLGRVELRVTVRADAVHAALYAQQDNAREALVAHRPALEAALGRSQLRLETFSVGLGQHELGDPGRQGAQAEPAPDEIPARSAARSAPVPAATPTAALAPATSRGLSLRA